MTCENTTCEPSLEIVAGNQLTPLAFLLLQSDRPVELSDASVKAKLVAEIGGDVVLEYTAAGITIQPTSTLESIDADGWIRVIRHNLTNGDQVRFTTTETLPTGITADVPYFVRDSSPNEFRIAARPGGVRIKPTGGAGVQTLVRVGVVFWELPTTVTPGTYRVWLQRAVSSKTDDFGQPSGLLLTVR